MTSHHDPHGLDRFVEAQAPVWAGVRAELAAGAKTSHWMWFVFPQLRGLGSSAMAQHYGIASLAEAQAYLAHPLLGPRLREGVALLLAQRGRSAREIFGATDEMKLRSSLTLFAQAVRGGADEPLFRQALARYFDGAQDARTLALLQAADGPRA
ncbi:MAG: DUF1810 domain-containing protein [Burkholderiaceae bacterium]|jgi:uncharacterized protein (DUF1810 family)|nr:MAG: DUF1810 domain-containing protein [Burkholderiaceae bacterium]